MNGMRLELKIIDLFWRNPDKSFTINAVAKILKETYSYTNRVITQMIHEKMLNKNVIGHAFQCTLNKDSDKARAVIHLSEVLRKERYIKKYKYLDLLFQDFLEQCAEKVLSVVLFGSYVKESFTKESDIDLLMITSKKIDVGKTIRSIYALHGKEISPIILTKEEFMKRKNESLIKEIQKNHIIIKGFEYYLEGALHEK